MWKIEEKLPKYLDIDENDPSLKISKEEEYFISNKGVPHKRGLHYLK